MIDYMPVALNYSYSHLPIARGTCKKANLSRLVKPADLSQISPASQPPAF